ncbi:hypothetical protein DE146DRAFT_647959 [Phaeosphaeria sp. MPI-PUGE-AT-0046c]|nr:hypothetical protein DE146DRAFT_647959 [Phaeosphaeria sp. MPI-PUGE-AT-0046c]
MDHRRVAIRSHDDVLIKAALPAYLRDSSQMTGFCCPLLDTVRAPLRILRIRNARTHPLTLASSVGVAHPAITPTLRLGNQHYTMASPLTSPPTFGEHQIEAVQRLLVYMGPESIKDYAKARDALGKEELAYRLKAIKELPSDVLAMVVQEAQTRDPKRFPVRPQAQPTEATSLKRPRTDTHASETTTPKPARKLDLPYLAASCNKLDKCNELWMRESNFRNHFGKHLLSTDFKAKDGSGGWVCDPETCKEAFADAGGFMAHIWKSHMQVVPRQRTGHVQPPVGASGYSPTSQSVPHTPGDDPTFSPHSTAFTPLPCLAPNTMTPNATVSHSSPFTTSAQTKLPVEAQSPVPRDMRSAGAFSGNGYPHAMHGNNNNNMQHGMPHSNIPYGFDLHTVLPSGNVTHSHLGQNRARAFAPDNMMGWPDQYYPAALSSNPAAGQPYPTHTNYDLNKFAADPHFG